MAAAAEPPQPGPRRLRRLARARPARLQLPDRRHPRRDRARAAREARRRSSRRAPTSPRATRELLADVAGLELPCADDADHERSWFVYVVTLPAGCRPRGGDRVALRERGVQTARYLPCIHLQPYMRERFGFREGLCPVAEEIASRTLALPFHARLAEDDQAYVADALRAALGVVARGPSQGEALATWALWGAHRRGRAGRRTAGSTRPRRTTSRAKGSRAGSVGALTLVNFPIATRRDRARPRRRWPRFRGARGGPRRPRSRCAPRSRGSTSRSDLDAHWGNAVPALGVVDRGCADRRGDAPRRARHSHRGGPGTRRASSSPPSSSSSRCRGSAAELGFHFPGDLFMGEELGREKDGTLDRRGSPRPPPRRRTARCWCSRRCFSRASSSSERRCVS